MIHLNFSFNNPWSKRFDNVKQYSGQLPVENKYWELEILRTSTILNLYVGFTTRRDHAGFNFNIGLFGREIVFTVYDCRHWDYEKDCWCNNGDNNE